jgi:hypothetical protein
VEQTAVTIFTWRDDLEYSQLGVKRFFYFHSLCDMTPSLMLRNTFHLVALKNSAQERKSYTFRL